jgi:hypothetical protein
MKPPPPIAMKRLGAVDVSSTLHKTIHVMGKEVRWKIVFFGKLPDFEGILTT